MTAKPLTSCDAHELTSEGCGDLIVEINGQLYNCEDLPCCDGCEDPVLEVDDWGFCDMCSGEVCAEKQHDQQLRSDYLARVL